jgi:hypothetical protein
MRAGEASGGPEGPAPTPKPQSRLTSFLESRGGYSLFPQVDDWLDLTAMAAIRTKIICSRAALSCRAIVVWTLRRGRTKKGLGSFRGPLTAADIHPANGQNR